MSIILNKGEIATNQLRRDALDILEAGLEAVETGKVLRKKVKVENGILNIDGNFLDLNNYERIFFVGIGKCALSGAAVIEGMLGKKLTAGIALDVKEAADAEALASQSKIKYFQGTHPLPSEQNVEATKEILEMVKGVTEKDLVVCLVSGGGSALFELPIPRFNLDTIIQKTKELTAKGADIYELNAARKEMSQVKGGKFAELCQPAHMVSLIFSDVPGNDPGVIASGPTILPSPASRRGAGGEVRNILICSNTDALEAMEEKAAELGYAATIETDRLTGNAAETGKELAEREVKPKSCILFGGETTVIISQDHGTGGRNQELALSALLNIKENSLVLSAASDGWDNTDHAGALSDKELLEKSKQLGLNAEEFLKKSDSYNFFVQASGAISTGKLESNVSDLVILMYN